MNSMKVLHVVATMDPLAGGVAEAVLQIAGGLSGHGVRNTVVSLDVTPQVERDDLPMIVLGPGLTAFGYSRRMLSWLKENVENYDWVIIHGLWMHLGMATRQACLMKNVKYGVYTHGMLDPWFKQAHPLKHIKKWFFWPWSDYRVLRDANYVMFTCEEEKRLARESFWLYRAKELVAGLGIRKPNLDQDQLKESFYCRYPQCRGKRLFLFLGRLHPKKGCDLLIRAFAEMATQDESAVLLMVGPDSVGWKSELMESAEVLGVSSRVEWLGMLKDDLKWAAFCASELFLLPSHQENFGISVVEALVCSLPVLISDKVNVYFEVEEDRAGLICSDEFESLVQSWGQWMTLSAASREAYGQRAQRCFDQRFEIGQVTARLFRVLNR